MRADKLPWLVPMRMQRPSSLHLSTRGVNTCNRHDEGASELTRREGSLRWGSEAHSAHIPPPPHHNPAAAASMLTSSMWSRSSANCLGSS